MQKSLVLLDIDDVLFDTEHFINTNLREFRLYPDVLDTLVALSQIAKIGILSQGENALQTQKLVATGIYDYIVREYLYIVAKKDESLQEIIRPCFDLKSIYFVDDRVLGLFYAKKAIPHLHTIWLKRGRYANNQENTLDFKPEKTITALSEILPYLQNGS